MADATTATTTAQLWPLIHEQRQKLGDVFAALGDPDWEAQSLCSGWKVRDVAAHCIETQLMTPMRFVGQLAGAGFRFHGMTAKGVAQHKNDTAAQLLDQYRQTMTRTTAPPGPKVAMLAEAVIHGEDAARPSGKRINVSPAALVTVAHFTRGATPLLHGKQRSAGLHLRATDVDWGAGEGPEVSGPAIALILAMAGRQAGLDELGGEGLETLRSRM